MKKQIFNKIVNYYRECDCDRYGEINTIDIYRIIDASDEKQLNALKSLVVVNTYGGRFGTYQAFNPWGAFKCDKLKEMCTNAFKNNKSRIQNLNSW